MTIDELKSKIIPILNQHRVKKAGIFGSIARGEGGEDSDIDILVELGRKDVSLFDFIRIKLELEAALKRKVDLVEYSTIKSVIKNVILSEEVPIL